MPGKALRDISDLVQREITARGLASGLLTVWCTHTGASHLVQANADDDFAADIVAFFDELVPMRPGHYRHAPSQLRALLAQTQLFLPVEPRQLPLGEVQSLYVFEHRDVGRTRRLRAHFTGD